MSERLSGTSNPCLRCGACCAAFRVSFYWSEAEAFGLPEPLTEPVGRFFSCMAGTNASSPRCTALEGVVGEEVSCSAYHCRPSPCREVEPGDDKCAVARARYGLPALAPGSQRRRDGALLAGGDGVDSFAGLARDSGVTVNREPPPGGGHRCACTLRLSGAESLRGRLLRTGPHGHPPQEQPQDDCDRQQHPPVPG